MKLIIALCGVANTGKTHTLNMLIRLLKPQIESPGKLCEDRQTCIVYNGYQIAITTSGDDRIEVERNIQFCKDKGCNILITATRTKGGSIESLDKFSEETSCDIRKIQKNKAASKIEEELVNGSQARDIQAILDKF